MNKIDVENHQSECDRTRTLIKKKALVGAWETEPDRKLWKHKGFDCLVVRSPWTFALCGYVGVPKTHPLFRKNYNDVYESHPKVSAHGGLTYSEKCQGAICHPVEEEGDEVWWFGFDCAHAGDITPGSDALLPSSFLENCPPRYSTYKSLDYVENEVNQLAEQLGKIK